MNEYFDRLYKNSKDEFFKELKENLKNNKKEFIITANPETFMYGEKDEEINKMLLDKENVISPDGIGIVKSANMLNYNVDRKSVV